MNKLPQRPRTHILEDESLEFVRRILPKGWIVEKASKDYGVDLIIEIVENGNVTGKHFLMQVKSTDKLLINKKDYISRPCKTSTLQYFLERPELVIYLVYDSINEVGYWIWVQDFLRGQSNLDWKKKDTFTVKIPSNSTFTSDVIEKIKKRVDQLHKKEKIINTIETLDHPGLRYGVEFNGSTTTISAYSKYPGAEQDYPLNFGLTLNFDNSEEGKKAQKALDDAFKKGTRAEINAPFIKEFKIPREFDFENLLFEDEFKPDGLIIQPLKRDRKLITKVEVYNKEDKLVAYVPYVELKEIRYGTDEILMSNEEQSIPQKFSLIVNMPKRESVLSFNLQYVGWNVYLVKEVFNLQKALALGGKLRLVHINTGTTLIDKVFSDNLISKPLDSLIEIADDLVTIQQKLKLSVSWPEKIFIQDYHLIKNIIRIITTGESYIKGPISLNFDKLSAKQFAESFLRNKDLKLGIEGESEDINLLNQKIKLGHARILLKSARLTKKTIQTLSSIELLEDDAKVQVEIEIDGDIIIQYLDWLPKNDNGE